MGSPGADGGMGGNGGKGGEAVPALAAHRRSGGDGVFEGIAVLGLGFGGAPGVVVAGTSGAPAERR